MRLLTTMGRQVRKCAALCNSKGKQFFAFPKDHASFMIWLKAIDREDLKNRKPSSLRVCEQHFSRHMFGQLGRRLMRCAVPDVKLSGEDLSLSIKIASNRPRFVMKENQLNDKPGTTDIKATNSCDRRENRINSLNNKVAVKKIIRINKKNREKRTSINNSVKKLPLNYIKQPKNKPVEPKEIVEEILVCSICYALYHTVDLLKNHMIESHGYSIKPSKDSTTKELSDSEKSDDHDSDDPYAHVKEDKIVSFTQLKNRLLENYMYKCAFKGCRFKFETLEKQEKHSKCHISTNNEKIRNFKCLECGINKPSWRSCSLHMFKEHDIDIDFMQCPECEHKVLDFNFMKKHLRLHSKWFKLFRKQKFMVNSGKDGTRWYSQKTCPICNRRFANSRTLTKHVKAVHNKIKPFICNVCGKKSAMKSTCIVHMRQHTGEKPFKCKTCSFRASDPSVLKSHEMRHNNTSRYSCGACEYTSIQSSSLKNHIKLCHPADFKKISCDECKYVSISSDLLEAHKKDHKKGLIQNEDSSEPANAKNIMNFKQPERPVGNVEISSDCFLPLESTDSIAHDPSIDTGGVTIPAHSEDTQFPS